MGQTEVEKAVGYLRERLGDAPSVAVVLGSGLAATLESGGLETSSVAEVPYGDIPFWQVGGVPGHPYRLALARQGSATVALLQGRLHGYEGFDLSQLQLTVETLASWGVGRVLLTSSCGAVADDRAPGDVVIALEVLDCQTEGLCRPVPATTPAPGRLTATSQEFAEQVLEAAHRPVWLSTGIHASVPGPQYETAAELQLLRVLGATTVSMSGAPELLALQRLGVETAVLGLVVNAGHTTHGGVLAGARDARASFSAAVAAMLACWLR